MHDIVPVYQLFNDPANKGYPTEEEPQRLHVTLYHLITHDLC